MMVKVMTAQVLRPSAIDLKEITAGLDLQYKHTKKIIKKKRKGYDNSETTIGKLSTRKIQI